MKTSRQRLAMMALVLSFAATTFAVEIDGISYSLIGRRLTAIVQKIGDGRKGGYKGNIVIPEQVTYNGNVYTVREVAPNAFWACDSLISVSLPESVEKIHEFAFAGCGMLTSVNIPNKVYTISEKCFSGCEKLDSVLLPSGVTSIGKFAFNDCKSLRSIVLPESLKVINEEAFANCRSLDSLAIPAKVESIGEKAFVCCTNLKSLKVAEGNSVYDSRNNCNAIIKTASSTLIVGCSTTIVPHDVTTIGANAFREMTFTGAMLPEGVKIIGKYAFWGSSCDNALIIPESVDSIADAAFVLCDVDSIIIRGQISSLKTNTFEACKSLTYIELPNSLKYIGDYPFNDCRNLQKIVCKASIPPKCTYWSFKFAGKRMTLEVPKESIELYKEATVWENFYCIKTEDTEGNIKQPDPNRNIVKKGNGIYYATEDGECTYLYSYDYEYGDTTADRTDFTEWERWNDAIVIDVDTIGPNAFSNCNFRSGQIIYLTDKVNTILEDAFSYINIAGRIVIGIPDISEHMTLVFEGEFPPNIDKDNIMNYDDSTCEINFAVPNIVNYITNDIQWTYTTLMTIDDLVRGYISPENEVTVNDSTETDVNMQPGTNQDGNIDLVVHARPRKEIPVRVGEGENKDIYSRAPAWMRYTMELRITDSEGTELYTGEMQCNAYGECQFNVSFACPTNNIIHIYSRSIDMFGRATEWAVTTINLDTSISPTVASNTDVPYYDLQGRPIAHPTRGIYIRNGKKVIL